MTVVNGWGDTLVSSLIVALGATSPVALSMQADSRDWFVIGFTFLLAFSGAVAQHRRHPARNQWSSDKRLKNRKEKEA